jgi:hypothetical protein
MATSPLRRAVAIIASQSAIALALTWPLVLHEGSEIAIGDERAATVPLFNLWTLEWNAQRFAHGLRGYWDAPIFAPHKSMFARSEAQPLTGLVFWCYRWFAGNVGAYNLVLLTMLLLNGLAGYALARRLRADFVPALLVGALAQALPFVWNQLGVIQLVAIFPMLLALERTFAYREHPQLATALHIAALVAIAEFTSGYYAIFLLVMLITTLPIMLWKCAPLRTLFVHGLGAVALLALLAGPFATAQQSRTHGLRWTTTTVAALSARPAAWLHHSERGVDVPWSSATPDNEAALFPGGYMLVLATVGIGFALKARRRRAVACFVAILLSMTALAGGLRWRFGTWRPYSLLYDHVPGFDRLRSPFRFTVGAQIALIGLAALGVAGLWRWRANVGRVLAIAFVSLSLLETVHFGVRLEATRDATRTDWVQWLERRPGGAVAMVPFPNGPSADDYADTTVAMLAGLEHGHPLVNGYTGLFPDDYANELFGAMASFPDDLSATLLAQRRTRYLVARRDWLTAARLEQLRAYGYAPVFGGRDRVVLRATGRSA